VDLVCGPVSPLPETHQRYRLVAHIGSGGQAEVYRAVRVTGGVSSAPMTVKVFRIDPRRPLADELRSWDKGDAVLMDLNNRGVTGICRRSDGFYGPPPHRPGERPATGDAVPYQVYEYLHGLNLREYVTRQGRWAGPRVNALTVLRTLAGVLRELHHPQIGGATPVLHMDIKPSNVMVLEATGEARVIDFTGARYYREAEITQVSYTPESGGPEAFGGVRAVTPAYDVHGFGAVAYFLVTGAYPRVESVRGPYGESSAPPWSTLRRHPMLERTTRLRDHLHAPVADRPGERPETRELTGWLETLAGLVRSYGVPDTGVDWHEPGEAQTSPRRASATVTATARVGAVATPSATRIERPPPAAANATGGRPERPPEPAGTAPINLDGDRGAGGSAGGSADAPTSGPPVRGRASVPPPRPPRADTGVIIDPLGAAEPSRPWQPTNEDPRILKLGWEYSGIGAAFAFVCWGIWAASNGGNLVSPVITFLVVLVVAGGVFALSRLIGRLVLVQRMGRVRRTARGAHAAAGVFLALAGLAYLKQTPWVVEILTWFRSLF
jgi:serine/threonine protein kinase